MQITKSIHRTLLAGTLVAASAAIALADFPNRNIEIIHPWGPGNAMAMSQVVAKAMGEELGTDMPVISLPGAAGTKAQTTAMGKPADGYTIFDGYVAPLVLQPIWGTQIGTIKTSNHLAQQWQMHFQLQDRWTKHAGQTLKR